MSSKRGEIARLSQEEFWETSQFNSFSREKALQLFMGVAQVPDEWNRIYILSDRDFQIAMSCVNAAIKTSKLVEGGKFPGSLERYENGSGLNNSVFQFGTFTVN